MAVYDLSYTNSESTILDLNDGATYALRRMPSGILRPMLNTVTEPTPRKNPASFYLGSPDAERKVDIELLVRGASPAALTTAIVALWSHLWVDCRELTEGVLDFTAANGNRRLIRAVVDEGDADVNEWLADCDDSDGAALVVLPFRCPDPTFYAASNSSASGNFDDATPVEIECVNPGDAPGYPTIVITGEVEAPSITDAYGHVLAFSETVAAGRTLTIIMDPHGYSMVYSDGSVSWYGYRTASGSQDLAIKPGTHDLEIVATSGTGAISVTWPARYSRHG